MRTIKKSHGDRNRNLEKAEQNNGVPQTKDEATRAWGNFSDHGNSLALKLLRQQFGLCCYTELNLADLHREKGAGAHFEHEQPKSKFPGRTFDESNILRCSLASTDQKSYRGTQCFGGHHKLGDYDQRLFISPQSESCREFFTYLPDGTIHPKDDELSDRASFDKAKYTIGLLNLNAPFLIAERKRWLDEIRSEIDHLVQEGNLDAIENFAAFELCLTRKSHPEHTGNEFEQLNRFHSAVRDLFGSTGERVIAQECAQID